MLDPSNARSFTTTSTGGLLAQLVNDCRVSEPWDPESDDPPPIEKTFQGLWDTGATGSMVSQNVVDSCGLVPVYTTDVYHATGITHDVPVYVVDILLANEVRVTGVLVTAGNFQGADVLIGMDIISLGDLAITNWNSITKFTFRVPSIGHIDFVEETNRAVQSRTTNPNRAERRRRQRGN